jgi:hypothetical protein
MGFFFQKHLMFCSLWSTFFGPQNARFQELPPPGPLLALSLIFRYLLKFKKYLWTMTILKVCIFVDFNSIFYQHLQIIDVCIFKLIKCIKICAMCYFIIVCENHHHHMMNFIVPDKKSILWLTALIWPVKCYENNDLTNLQNCDGSSVGWHFFVDFSPVSVAILFFVTFLADLAKGNVSFCHHLASVVR